MYQIISQQDDFIVIEKHAGIHFHSQDGQAGVVAQVEADLGKKLFAVHRLDTPTSGLLILAKSSQAAARFTDMFSQHQVQKYYLALAKGKPKKKQGWIIGDMAKSRRSMYKLLRSQQNPAITQFFSHGLGDGLRAYVLKPLSGKTHQLRVALASIGVPILGDTLYGSAQDNLDRCYLHAFALRFDYQGQGYSFECLPTQGEAFLEEGFTQLLTADWQSPEMMPWPKTKAEHKPQR